uniref:Uncharacterized protein n=1 Tax=Glossina austeni TaxID=7395 RepID=A0A1A9VIA2_GLOAU
MNKQENEEEEEEIPTFRSSRSIVQPTRLTRASSKSPLEETPDGNQVTEPLPSPSPLIKSESLEKKNSLAPELKKSLLAPVPIIKSEPRASSINPAKLSEKEGSTARSVKLNEQLGQSQTDLHFDKNLKRFSFKKLLPSYWLSSTYNKRDSSSAKPKPIPVKKELKSPPVEEIPLKKYSFRRLLGRRSARSS